MICPASIPLVSCGEWFISMNWYEQDCEFLFLTNDSVNGVHIPFTDVQRSFFSSQFDLEIAIPYRSDFSVAITSPREQIASGPLRLFRDAPSGFSR